MYLTETLYSVGHLCTESGFIANTYESKRTEVDLDPVEHHFLSLYLLFKSAWLELRMHLVIFLLSRVTK